MSVRAIVYTSEAGHTKRYAELLSAKTKVPCFSLEEAKEKVSKGSDILYMGWLMAGSVKGYRKASRMYSVKAVCPVGMLQLEEQRESIRKQNKMGDTPMFLLQGGFDMTKLHGLYKFMMSIPVSAFKKTEKDGKEKKPEEKMALEMFLHGKDCVSEKNLKDVIDWVKKN